MWIQDDVLYEGITDSGENPENIFSTFNEIMDAMGQKFTENKINDPINFNIIKNYLKFGSQSNNILKKIMDEISISFLGIEGEIDKENDIKILNGMKNPIAKVIKFYIKHDVNDKLK